MPDEVIAGRPGFELDWAATDRGFGLASFTDVNGNECSIQESLPLLPRLWLGVRKPSRDVMPASMSPSECDFVCQNSTRMHLSRSQAMALACATTAWAERQDDLTITSDG